MVAVVVVVPYMYTITYYLVAKTTFSVRAETGRVHACTNQSRKFQRNVLCCLLC